MCQLEPKPWPEGGRVQPNVAVGERFELFGLPATSPQLRERVQPLGLGERVAHEESDEIDFRFDCGLELDFAPARNLKGAYRTRIARRGPETMVLGAVRFFRSRDLDARQWTGELPFGLAFDDTQRLIQAKVGRKPNEHEDDDLDGYALWRFHDYSLHILYDNMKNRLQRISIMAPGFD